MIQVLRAGSCDLVMDLGRPGWGAAGVPVGGAADPQALAAVNRLVGNAGTDAGVEVLYNGPTLRFPQGGVVALAGERFEGKRDDGRDVPWNETLMLAAGETLTLGRAVTGCRCWLAVRGGIDVPSVLGSRSTFLPAGFGGFEGRVLRAGDTLPVGASSGKAALTHARPPVWAADAPLRVVPGPQLGAFDDRGLAAFFGSAYRVDAASDRRGVRLTGAHCTHARNELPSQGVLPGVVQVPPDGQPIILGWDGPVTGGYPVIAGVITADWPRLAQLQPGDTVRFVTIDLERARALATRQWDLGERG